MSNHRANGVLRLAPTHRSELRSRLLLRELNLGSAIRLHFFQLRIRSLQRIGFEAQRGQE
jgi:hypothetical protein